jgi:hypothetical protein
MRKIRDLISRGDAETAEKRSIVEFFSAVSASPREKTSPGHCPVKGQG